VNTPTPGALCPGYAPRPTAPDAVHESGSRPIRTLGLLSKKARHPPASTPASEENLEGLRRPAAPGSLISILPSVVGGPRRLGPTRTCIGFPAKALRPPTKGGGPMYRRKNPDEAAPLVAAQASTAEDTKVPHGPLIRSKASASAK